MFDQNVNIDYWWVGLGSFVLCLFAHIAIWRYQPKKRKISVLFVVLLFAPLIVYLMTALLASTHTPWAIAYLTHLVISANYIAIYPAFQASSPTILILCLLRKHPRGIPRETVVQSLSTNKSLEERLSDLAEAKLIVQRPHQVELSVRGTLLATAFISYRKLIGLPPGEG